MALWTVHGDGRRLPDGEVVGTDERLSWPLTIGLGLQHAVAMFGATVLVPELTHFPVGTTLLFSGVGTLLFLLLTRNRIPTYVGSSFAFVAPLVAAGAQGFAAQLGGVVFAGVLVMVIGVAVKALGIRLVDSVLPPVVAGGIIVLISLNLATTAGADVAAGPLPALVTLIAIVACVVLSRGLLTRLGVLVGVLVGWLGAALFGALDPVKLATLRSAGWIGMPTLHQPVLRPSVMLMVLPAVLVLTAQNVGSVKAVGTITGRDLDGSVGDALIANGLVTAVSGAGGGVGLGPLGQNVGVLAATKVYSTAACAVAALGAIAMAFSPKLDAALDTVPTGVLGAAALVLFGMVAMVGVRTWLDHKVNLADPLNMVVIGVAVIVGAGNLTIDIGSLRLDGIAWGALLIVIGHPLLRTLRAARR